MSGYDLIWGQTAEYSRIPFNIQTFICIYRIIGFWTPILLLHHKLVPVHEAKLCGIADRCQCRKHSVDHGHDHLLPKLLEVENQLLEVFFLVVCEFVVEVNLEEAILALCASMSNCWRLLSGTAKSSNVAPSSVAALASLGFKNDVKQRFPPYIDARDAFKKIEKVRLASSTNSSICFTILFWF